MGNFTIEQRRAIEEKIELFWPAFRYRFYPDEFRMKLSEIEAQITAKRLDWFKENNDKLEYLKSDKLMHIDKAFYLLYGEYMRIPFKELEIHGIEKVFQKIIDQDQGFILIDVHSRNFCPYLEAFKRLGLKPSESVDLCRAVLEKPCQELVKKVDPRIRFLRIYENGVEDNGNVKCGIRPLNDYCSERLVIWDGDLIFKLFYEKDFREQGLLGE